METRFDYIDVKASRDAIWALITTPDRLAKFSFGLTFCSTWAEGAPVQVRHGPRLLAEGTVICACAPQLLVYRLDEPETGDVNYWVTWQLWPLGGGTRVSHIVDSPRDGVPDYGEQLLRNLQAA